MASGPLRLIETDVPEPGAGELLLRVRACGVCRTDLHVAEGDLPVRLPGVTPGHEIVGEVVAAGPGCLHSPGDRVGVAWGRTVYAIADAMSYADRHGVSVVELCGNLGSPYAYRPDQCTMEIARRLNAQGLNVYAPLVLSSDALARGLREEPVIREQLDRVSACDMALFSVGTLAEDSHVVRCGALSPKELAAIKEMGGVGVIAGQVIAADGTWLDCDYNRRIISADFDAIRAIPRRLMVVQEDEKLEPLLAAINGRFFTHLVTTARIAERLLERLNAKADEGEPARISA